MSDRCAVLKTTMSCALTSSSASTITRCSFLMSMRPGVEVLRTNIVEHRGRNQRRQPRRVRHRAPEDPADLQRGDALANARRCLDYLIKTSLRLTTYDGREGAYVYSERKSKLGGAGIALYLYLTFRNKVQVKHLDVAAIVRRGVKKETGQVPEIEEMAGFHAE